MKVTRELVTRGYARAGVAVAVMALPFGVFAQEASGPDFSSLTGSIDFGTVVTAIMALAALMVVPKVAGWGARKVLGFIRG